MTGAWAHQGGGALYSNRSLYRIDNSFIVGAEMADRSIRDEGTVPFTFLGEQAYFPTGPFRAAVMLQRPMVLMIGLFSGGNRYDIYFESLIDMNAVEVSGGKAAIDAAMTRYVERLEHYCRLAPYHWFNFYDFWK